MHRYSSYIIVCVCLIILYAADSYFNPTSFAVFLPSPPADGSPAQLIELQGIIESQKNLTVEQIKYIEPDTDLSVFGFAYAIFGPNFTENRFPALAKFFYQVRRVSDNSITPLKDTFMRMRPFQSDRGVLTVTDAMESSASPSYPSLHAAFGMETAIFLSKMVPERTVELFARNTEYARERVICGLAYPSDLKAGQIGGASLAADIIEQPEFRDEFDAARIELRKGLNLAP
jgi:acid phosphatase (class A)